MSEQRYTGIIIEESLSNTAILQDVNIVNTDIEPVTNKHKTPWVNWWTKHTVEIQPSQAGIIAERLKDSLDKEHAWYADFKSDGYHYIIFNDKIFKVLRKHPEEYDQVSRHGISLGIPKYQLDFT
jgi:ATP-dependent protease HslVU (ClpYQ) ATPase subunit